MRSPAKTGDAFLVISFEKAQEIIRQLRADLRIESLPITDCVGRTHAGSCLAKFDSPRFTNSAMDGYAVCFEELDRFSRFEKTSPRYAESGAVANDLHLAGQTTPIMTGAELPVWADTVIAVERSHIDASDQTVSFDSGVEKGQHIRRRGEDLPSGQVLIEEGRLIKPEQVLLAANFGHPTLEVYQTPKVLIVSTGDELVELGDPLPKGGIYNSSRYFLESSLREQGISPVVLGNCPDEPRALIDLLEKNLDDSQPTLILSTGAVSAGEKDFIPSTALEMGFETLFHRVAVRPGKPIFLAARHKNLLWMGLPGNAISTVTSWYFFVRPLLGSWAKLGAVQMEKHTLKKDVSKPEGLRCFWRGIVDSEGVELLSGQGSAHLLATTVANAYISLLEGKNQVPAGMEVDVLRF